MFLLQLGCFCVRYLPYIHIHISDLFYHDQQVTAVVIVLVVVVKSDGG